jgi:hypothetical protein
MRGVREARRLTVREEAREVLELAPYLRETFSQGEDPNDEDAPECEQERTIVEVEGLARLGRKEGLTLVTIDMHKLQSTIVRSCSHFQGYACPNKDCGIRLHTFCVAQRLGQDGRCPARLDQQTCCRTLHAAGRP